MAKPTTIRIDEQVLEKADELFPLLGYRTRSEFVETLLRRVIEEGYTPSKTGEGIRANSIHGGTLTMILDAGFVVSGSSGLTEAEQVLFKQAESLVKQGNWVTARQLLTENKFDIRYIRGGGSLRPTPL